MYNCEIVTNIKRNDGVEAIILSVVNISFPSNSHDIITGTSGGGSEYGIEIILIDMEISLKLHLISKQVK